MFSVVFPLEKIEQQTDAAKLALIVGRPTCLEQLGIQVLSFAQLDYVTKARGGTGTDGIKWDEVVRATIEHRVRSRAPAKRIVQQRRDLADQIRTARNSKGKRGKESRKWAKGEIARLIQRRKDLLAKLNDMIDMEWTDYEIGVDHGLQRASAQPGFTGPDGDGGNVMVIDQAGITVGYGRSYSKWFDIRRPLLPEVLPVSWVATLEGIAGKWAGVIVQHELGKI